MERLSTNLRSMRQCVHGTTAVSLNGCFPVCGHIYLYRTTKRLKIPRATPNSFKQRKYLNGSSKNFKNLQKTRKTSREK